MKHLWSRIAQQTGRLSSRPRHSSTPQRNLRRVGAPIRSAWGLSLLTLIGLCACAPSVPPATSAAGISRLPGLRPIALFRFVDRRGQEPTLVGHDFFHGRSSILFPIDSGPRPVRVARPVDTLVTEAVVAAFKARGFPVVDRTDTAFGPGVIIPDGTIAVSGEVLRYWLESHTVVRGPSSGFVTRGDCQVVVRLHGRDGGAPLLEKRYSARAESGGRKDLGVLTEALDQVVWQAATDYELTKSLR